MCRRVCVYVCVCVCMCVGVCVCACPFGWWGGCLVCWLSVCYVCLRVLSVVRVCMCVGVCCGMGWFLVCCFVFVGMCGWSCVWLVVRVLYVRVRLHVCVFGCVHVWLCASLRDVNCC